MTQTQYYSTSKAQWQHHNAIGAHRRQANQNMRAHDIVRHVTGTNLTHRMSVLAQILSPTGRVHVHHKVPLKMVCASRTICWYSPERAE